MKRIVFFSRNLKIGGMEKAMVYLLNELVNKYDITLVLERKEGPLLNQLDNRIKIEEYKLSSSKNILIRKISNGIKRFLYILKNKNKYDFSCSYATYSIICAKLAQISSQNSTLYVHNDYCAFFKNDIEKIKDFFNSLHYNNFKTLIFVSNEAKNGLEQCLKPTNNFITINNLAKPDEIIALSNEKLKEKVFDDENINLIFVGRLDNDAKNFDLMLESFHLAFKKKNNLKLFLVGNGDYRQQIEEYIKENKLANNVIMLGEKINPYPYVKGADSIIMTSRYEGFPLVYTEALILNQKVITVFPTSDAFVDVRDYFSCVQPNSSKISEAILNIDKSRPDYKLDFKENNKKILEDFESLIEGGESR